MDTSSATYDDVVARIKQLEEQNSHLRQQNQQLIDEGNALLRSTTPPTQSHPVVSVAAVPPTLKVVLPEKFSGRRENFRAFAIQVDDLFSLHVARYPDDFTKIRTVGSLLTDEAAAWYAAVRAKPQLHAEVLASFEVFFEKLRGMFGPVGEEAVAERKIRALRQGRQSAAVYGTKFLECVAHLEWNDAAFISQYRTGLCDDVKDMLLNYVEPNTLAAMMELAISCDQRLHERRLERGVRVRPLPPAPMPTAPLFGDRSTRTPPNNHYAMDIDAVSNRPIGADGRLLPEERERRLRLGLCLRCGLPGHRVSDHPDHHGRGADKQNRRGVAAVDISSGDPIPVPAAAVEGNGNGQ
jgi:hypothetical protein